jgi:hypothetical protein
MFMFIPIALADGSVAFVNLTQVVNVVRVSSEQCIINPVVGDSIIVNGKESVDAVIQAIRDPSVVAGSTEPQF